MRLLAILLLVSSVFGQQPVPEIRGVVLNFEPYGPLASAEVVLYEQGTQGLAEIATTLTNPRGEYVFRPGKTGKFYVEAKKAGYESISIRLADAEPRVHLVAVKDLPAEEIMLMRPGEIAGHLVDATGQPIPHLRAALLDQDLIGSYALETDENGSFRLSVPPGPYVIQTSPARFSVLDFTREAFETVDEEFESLYWPGGAGAAKAASPLKVAPGAIADFGIMTLRKVPRYRAHVSIEGVCSDDETWWFTVIPGSAKTLARFGSLGCRNEFVVAGLEPGNHLLAVRSEGHWGIVPLTIIDHNVEAKVVMSPNSQIEGRVLGPEGMPLSSLGGLRIFTVPAEWTLWGRAQVAQLDARGAFLFRNIQWKTQLLSVEPANPDTYVKEIQYGGVALNGPAFEAVAGAALEIVLDTEAASVEGIVTDPDWGSAETVLARWPLAQPVRRGKWVPFQYTQYGKFTISSLAPGEYRLIALPGGRLATLPEGELDRLLTEGTQVKVERGERKTFELKITR